jgi:predicted SAM-dependent methyltransferase
MKTMQTRHKNRLRAYLSTSSIGPAYMTLKIFCLRLKYVFYNRSIVKKYFKTNKTCKLQVGSGKNFLTGWLNTDLQASKNIVFLDASRKLPYPKESFNYIFSEHFIEHLDYAHGLKFLQECYRVLVPNGKIRIATPNLQSLIRLYGTDKDELTRHYIEAVSNALKLPAQDVFIINHMFSGYKHKFVYDHKTLAQSLTQCGFVNIEPCQPKNSKDPNLKDLEMQCHNEEIYKFETMVLEATKPFSPCVTN